jgi:hypothetical protein
MKDRKREREGMIEEDLELYRWNTHMIHQIDKAIFDSRRGAVMAVTGGESLAKIEAS